MVGRMNKVIAGSYSILFTDRLIHTINELNGLQDKIHFEHLTGEEHYELQFSKKAELLYNTQHLVR